MVDVDKLLKDGAIKRERAANRRKLLDELRRGTRRSIVAASMLLTFALVSFAYLSYEFLTSEAPMMKKDIVSCIIFGSLSASLFKAGFEALRPSPRDLFLLELLEEREKDE